MADDSKWITQLKELGAKLEELKTTEGWKAWLRTASYFHEYSMGNCVLIWSQRPAATRVAGYKAWQKMGRQVNKGERGIRIMAPMMIVDRSGDEDAHILRFRAVSVFDIAQTSGDPLPEDEIWGRVSVPDGTTFEQLMERVNERSDIMAWTAPAGPARGWTTFDPTVVTVVESSPPAMVRTLLHELGHAHDPDLDIKSYAQHRGTDELVAEASAWLVGQWLGIEMDEPSCVYLAGWQASDQDILTAASRVIATARSTFVLVNEEAMDGVPTR